MVFLLTITCVLAYIISTSYANGNNQMILLSTTSDSTTERDIKLLGSSEDQDSAEWQTIRMRVTAYCPCPKCCGGYSDGITASGYKIRRPDFLVAADRKYPFGTEVIVPGYKSGQPVKVLDRGHVIRGNRLDVFFNSHQEALKWGVKYLDVKICSQ